MNSDQRRGLAGYPFGLQYSPAVDVLHAFYLPALERARRYDRIAGYFSSGALSVAAQGLARFIQNDGEMRLLAGAQLSEDDVRAIELGESEQAVVERATARGFRETEDLLVRDRLAALAWMVAHQKLSIRVCVPVGRDRRPLPPRDADRYFHAKEGVFEDAFDQRMSFIGSGNESEAGWRKNFETFQVNCTWDRRIDGEVIGAASAAVRLAERRFEQLWKGEMEDWMVFPVPEAAKERLLQYTPSDPPEFDPLERRTNVPVPGVEVQPGGPEPASLEPDAGEVLAFQFLRDAPLLSGADGLGVATSPVTPWPHQRHVILGSVRRFPANRLFADEVGLGKTIEAGLALRQLVISKRVRRALLLVPRSVMRQWQEELYEKCVLNVPRLEQGRLLDVLDREVHGNGDPTPWNRVPLLLASSQLAKRKERQPELMAANDWDLVLVDEAHHARRKGGTTDEYRPNRLLELLHGNDKHGGLRSKARSLYLLTATPMQVHPVEVWDLLKVLGLGGRWGASERYFLRFYQELQKPAQDRDWNMLLDLVQDELEAGGAVDPDFETAARAKIGPVLWSSIRALPSSRDRLPVIRSLDGPALAVAHDFVHRHTPVRRLIWRNTRTLLKRYAAEGRISERVPDRDPENVWIPMTDEERGLYERIDEYISDFYRKYEERRGGTGFIMTVYRRRLTSSFEAIRKSLERRRAFLLGEIGASELVDDEDIEQEQLSEDFGESDELDADGHAEFQAELEYVEDFLHELRSLGSDSKVERLEDDLREIFLRRDSVIVFTQYTDTMDYLREALRSTYGDQVACYSGRGGERWTGFAWVEWEKEELKEAFRAGHSIRILLCTESASEGLNLQTCGVLINFDMPWNPMRVEQRIGRIDRIGQRYEEVWIRNYFYEETVEAQVYQRLGDRIDWFESVVGELQPILHQVGSLIQRLALLPPGSREAQLLQNVQRLREEVDEAKTAAFKLDEEIEAALPADLSADVPVRPEDIRGAFLQSPRWAPLLRPDPSVEDAFRLEWGGEIRRVTFDPSVFDRHPYQVRLLTYGDALFHELLTAACGPGDGGASEDDAASDLGIRRMIDDGPPPVALYLAPTEEGVYQIRRAQELQDRIREPSVEEGWDARQEQAATQEFETARHHARYSEEEEARARRESRRRTLAERAREVLLGAARIEAVRSEAPELGDEPVPGAIYGVEGVRGLVRHGVPFQGLLSIVGEDAPGVQHEDPELDAVRSKTTSVRERMWGDLRREGLAILRDYRDLREG